MDSHLFIFFGVLYFCFFPFYVSIVFHFVIDVFPDVYKPNFRISGAGEISFGSIPDTIPNDSLNLLIRIKVTNFHFLSCLVIFLFVHSNITFKLHFTRYNDNIKLKTFFSLFFSNFKASNRYVYG